MGSAADATSCDVSTIEQVLEGLRKLYLDSGRTEEARQALLARLAADDPRCGTTPAYLELKARYLSFAGEERAALAVIALVGDTDISEAVNFGNRLRQRYASDPRAALRLLRRAALAPQLPLLKPAIRWIHEGLAQGYAPSVQDRVKTPAHEAFLAALGDPSFPRLAEASSGLRLWVNAVAAASEPRQLASIAEESWSIRGPDARAERYRLLIAGLMDGRSETATSAIAMRERVIGDLERDLTGEPSVLRRYWLAYAHYAQGRALVGRDDSRSRRELRLAAEQAPSPDEALRALFYERACLGGPPEIDSASAAALEAAGALQDALELQVQQAIHDSSRMEAVRALHARAHPGQAFGPFWSEALERHLKMAPPLDLPRLAGGRLRLESLRGRWVVLDFWGTWCVPCLAEMPEVQALHDELLARAPTRATLVTVACNDRAEAVTAFLEKKGYTFPVLVGDESVEGAFEISQYPSRRLVTPTGRIIRLRGDDWQETVRGHVFGFVPPPQN